MRGELPSFALVLVAAALLGGCRPSATSEAAMITGGDIERGQSAIGKYGCAACHTIPGIHGANATVGPPLDRIAVRSYLAVSVKTRFKSIWLESHCCSAWASSDEWQAIFHDMYVGV